MGENSKTGEKTALEIVHGALREYMRVRGFNPPCVLMSVEFYERLCADADAMKLSSVTHKDGFIQLHGVSLVPVSWLVGPRSCVVPRGGETVLLECEASQAKYDAVVATLERVNAEQQAVVEQAEQARKQERATAEALSKTVTELRESEQRLGAERRITTVMASALTKAIEGDSASALLCLLAFTRADIEAVAKSMIVATTKSNQRCRALLRTAVAEAFKTEEATRTGAPRADEVLYLVLRAFDQWFRERAASSEPHELKEQGHE